MDLQSFLWFCNAVCKWQHPSSQLDSMFRQILQGLRASLGTKWDEAMATFPRMIRSILSERYSV